MSSYLLSETALPVKISTYRTLVSRFVDLCAGLSWNHVLFSDSWLRLRRDHGVSDQTWKNKWAITPHHRVLSRCRLDAVVAELYALSYEDLTHILHNDATDPKGFWRVDKDKPVELRQTTLTLLAFKRLKEVGLEEFLKEDWQFPKDIAERLGPRYLEWQKPNATAEEIKHSWEECEMHARNILGKDGFEKFMRELEVEQKGAAKTATEPTHMDEQGRLL